MTPRTVHLLLLALLCLPAVGVAVTALLTLLSTHNEFGGYYVVVAVGALMAFAVHAVVSSVLVKKLGISPLRVLGVHGALIGVVAGLFAAVELSQ